MIMTLMTKCTDSVQIAAIDEMSPANLVFLLGANAKQEPTSVSIVPIIMAIKLIISTACECHNLISRWSA